MLKTASQIKVSIIGKKKIKLTIGKIWKLFTNINLTPWVVLVLVAYSISSTIYLNRINRQLESRINATNERLSDTRNELDYSQKLTKNLAVYFEETDQKTTEGLIATIDWLEETVKRLEEEEIRLDKAIGVVNYNADIMDGNFVDMQRDLDTLRNAVVTLYSVR